MGYVAMQKLKTKTVLLVALAMAACEPSEDSYKGFLGIEDKTAQKAASSDGVSGDAVADALGEKNATDASNDAATAASQAAKRLENMSVSVAEWEDLAGQSRRCKAELETLKDSTATLLKAEYAKGEIACKDLSRKNLDEASKRMTEEAQILIDEISTRLARYSHPSAVVNGECEATMTSGQRYAYVLRNACVSVVNKKVGNDGEVSGLLGAVSPDAVREGIVSLDCDVGRAHIVLLPKKCDVTEGTASSAGRILPSAGSEAAPKAPTMKKVDASEVDGPKHKQKIEDAGAKAPAKAAPAKAGEKAPPKKAQAPKPDASPAPSEAAAEKATPTAAPNAPAAVPAEPKAEETPPKKLPAEVKKPQSAG